MTLAESGDLAGVDALVSMTSDDAKSSVDRLLGAAPVGLTRDEAWRRVRPGFVIGIDQARRLARNVGSPRDGTRPPWEPFDLDVLVEACDAECVPVLEEVLPGMSDVDRARLAAFVEHHRVDWEDGRVDAVARAARRHAQLASGSPDEVGKALAEGSVAPSVARSALRRIASEGVDALDVLVRYRGFIGCEELRMALDAVAWQLLPEDMEAFDESRREDALTVESGLEGEDVLVAWDRLGCSD